MGSFRRLLRHFVYTKASNLGVLLFSFALPALAPGPENDGDCGWSATVIVSGQALGF